ncbi:MAG: hypothetical protein Q8O67_29080 [Deltaproteobacteria bacterium]|nr:hypothetical protein [Deltaproteobacteria bacterium]
MVKRALGALAFAPLSLFGCLPDESSAGVNRCHAFSLAPPADAAPLDSRATQDFSLLADLNARFDDKCRFESEPTEIACVVGANNVSDCEVLLSEAVAISTQRDRTRRVLLFRL